MLDMYGTDLSVGDRVKVFGVYDNIQTQNWMITTYLGYEKVFGNLSAIVEGSNKYFDSQNIVYLPSNEIED